MTTITASEVGEEASLDVGRFRTEIACPERQDELAAIATSSSSRATRARAAKLAAQLFVTYRFKKLGTALRTVLVEEDDERVRSSLLEELADRVLFDEVGQLIACVAARSGESITLRRRAIEILRPAATASKPYVAQLGRKLNDENDPALVSLFANINTRFDV